MEPECRDCPPRDSFRSGLCSTLIKHSDPKVARNCPCYKCLVKGICTNLCHERLKYHVYYIQVTNKLFERSVKYYHENKSR
jgi:hypothetical protein